MKKTLITILIISITIIAIVLINISNIQIKQNSVKSYNKEFETFEEKTLYGADVLTIINKAINNNTEHSIQRDNERKLHR